MAKKPKRRELVGSPLPRPHAGPAVATCMACNMRGMSNKAMRDNAAAIGVDAKAYTGFLTGRSNHSIPVAQFHNGKQVGFIAIPLVDADSFIAEVSQQTTAYLQEMLDANTELGTDGAEAVGVADVEAEAGESPRVEAAGEPTSIDEDAARAAFEFGEDDE